MPERYAVPVSIMNHQDGKLVTLIYYAETSVQADLLADIVRELKFRLEEKSNWIPNRSGQNNWQQLQLRDVLPAAKVQQ